MYTLRQIVLNLIALPMWVAGIVLYILTYGWLTHFSLPELGVERPHLDRFDHDQTEYGRMPVRTVFSVVYMRAWISMYFPYSVCVGKFVFVNHNHHLTVLEHEGVHVRQSEDISALMLFLYLILLIPGMPVLHAVLIGLFFESLVGFGTSLLRNWSSKMTFMENVRERGYRQSESERAAYLFEGQGKWENYDQVLQLGGTSINSQEAIRDEKY